MKAKTLNIQHPYTVKKRNTNNAWGFGGTSGHEYVFNEHLSLVIGNAGTRHHGTFPHTTLWFQGVKVFDHSGYGKKQIAHAEKWINAILTGQYQEHDEHPYVSLLPEA